MPVKEVSEYTGNLWCLSFILSCLKLLLPVLLVPPLGQPSCLKNVFKMWDAQNSPYSALIVVTLW